MDTDRAIQEQDFLLSRECSLAALSIGHGLTLIRKYDFVKHGYGTQAFFMLSIGIERLLKIILIYNHRRDNNNEFPDNAALKKAGHNIKSMYTLAIGIAEKIRKPELYRQLIEDPIFDLILDFLTEFAHASRYYNLDTLTGTFNKADEPLRTWDRTVNKVIVERHYKHNLKKAATIGRISKAIDDHVIVSFDNEEGTNINNMQNFYLEGMIVNVKQQYSMFYVYRVVRFLSNLIWELDRGYYPIISEYFADFRCTDDSYIRRRKTWDIYKK